MLSAPRLSILITALAVSLVLQNSVLALTGGQYVAFESDLGFGGINLGSLFITWNQIVLVATSAVLMVGARALRLPHPVSAARCAPCRSTRTCAS